MTKPIGVLRFRRDGDLRWISDILYEIHLRCNSQRWRGHAAGHCQITNFTIDEMVARGPFRMPGLREGTLMTEISIYPVDVRFGICIDPLSLAGPKRVRMFDETDFHCFDFGELFDRPAAPEPDLLVEA